MSANYSVVIVLLLGASPTTGLASGLPLPYDADGDTVILRTEEICDGLDNDGDGTVDNGGDALCDDGNSCTRNTCEGVDGCADEVLADGSVCESDGDDCNGAEVCRDGTCVTEPDTAVAALVPMPGLTAIGGYRARDIANNDYAPRFYTKDGDPDYTASDYDQADVVVTYRRSGAFFEGRVEASGLKPNFSYQVKIVGMPSSEFGLAGDDAANERIGAAGRWFKKGSGNASQAQYEACRDDPDCTDIYQAYLVYGFFTTDELGRASYDFLADQSLHVLWRICPPERPMTGCGGPGGTDPVYHDVIALASTGYGYDTDHETWTIGIYGEIEKDPPAAWLAAGEYRCRFLLTEESFHESGRGGRWAAAVGAAGLHFWIDEPAGALDCGDGDVCNGYEACDPSGTCEPAGIDACDDGNVCTDDACDATEGCSWTDNTAVCDDGDPCTYDDHCAGGACVGTEDTTDTDGDGTLDCRDADDDNDGVLDADDCAPLDAGVSAPAGEAQGVAWAAGSVTVLTWLPGEQAEVSNVYRGTADPLFNQDWSCLAADVEGSSYEDPAVPNGGTAFHYLVTGENRCGESSAGADSSGIARPFTPCP